MKHEWKQTVFTPESLDGSGQYIVREGMNKTNYPHILDTGYLSTVLMKVGYSNSYKEFGLESQMMLIDMSDGLVTLGYYTNTYYGEDINNRKPLEEWVWNPFRGEKSYDAKVALCKYLNENPHGNTYRFATNEELIRVAAYQKWRTK